jgi:hypothetical protein
VILKITKLYKHSQWKLKPTLNFNGTKFLHLKTTTYCILHESFIHVLKLITKSTKSRATTPNLVKTKDKMPKKDKMYIVLKQRAKLLLLALLVVKEISFGVLDLLRPSFIIIFIFINFFFSNHVQLIFLFY